jgi:hypothetical protein
MDAVADAFVIATQGASHVRRVASPSMRSSLVLQLLVLRKALNICGTEELLGQRLDVSKGELRGWLAGQEMVPLATFNRAMRLVNGAYREQTARPRVRIH